MTKAKELKLLPKRTRPTAPTNPTTGSYQVSDALWEVLAPLLPQRVNTHPLGGGRSRVPDRTAPTVFSMCSALAAMEGVRFNGNLLRLHGPSAVSTMGRRRGVLAAMADGLERYDELKGLDWSWLSMDGAITKAPLGGGENRSQPY